MLESCVVYQIKNKLNNKIYIGSTIKSFSKRINEHTNTLNKNKHCNYHLQSAWKIYGFESFEFSIIEKVIDNSKLIEREQYWIDYYKSYDNNIGYNICKIAGNTIGRIHSSETKDKISKSKIGKKMTQETKDKISNSLIGRKSTRNYKKNYKKRHTLKTSIEKRHLTLETIEKMKKTKTIKYGKKISQFDMNDNKISDFDSIKQASEKTNIHIMLIYNVLNCNHKHTHKFVFKYT